MAKTKNTKGMALWLLPLLIAFLCLAFAWRWRIAKELDMDQRQAYSLAREAFRFMNKNADLPATAQNMTLTQTTSDHFVLEADGNKLTGDGPVPNRWIVDLRHVGDKWVVQKTAWK